MEAENFERKKERKKRKKERKGKAFFAAFVIVH
jgi:hypothetical protein